jgi:hypothetical protein
LIFFERVGDLLLFFGPNGFGKTSLAEAIEWLFYATTKRRQQGDTCSRSEYANSFANIHGGLPTEVSAKVQIGGRQLVVARRLTQGDASETLIDGVVASFSSISVNPIEAVYPVVAQHGLQTFVHSKPKDRRDASEAEHKAGCAVADDGVIAVEQFLFDGAGARGRHGEGPLHLLQHEGADMRLAQGSGEAFAGKPDLFGCIADLLAFPGHHEVDRGADLFGDAERWHGFGRRRGVEHGKGAFGRRDVFHVRHRRRFPATRNAPLRDVLQDGLCTTLGRPPVRPVSAGWLAARDRR